MLLNSNSYTLLIFFGYKGQNTKHIFWKVTKVSKIKLADSPKINLVTEINLRLASAAK